MAVQLNLSPSLVESWEHGHQTIQVFQRGCAKFSYTVSEEGTNRGGEFESNCYEPSYAATLIKIFKNTIADNLKHSTPDSNAFLPRLFMRPVVMPDRIVLPHWRVGLFGKVDRGTREILFAQWGVYDDIREEEIFTGAAQTIEETTPAMSSFLKEFLLYAPSFNKPHADFARHYALDRYAQSFRPFVFCKEDGTIEHIRLMRVSLIDSTIPLTPSRWAVTLVSTQESTRASSIFSRNVGHAMLVCESVEKQESSIESDQFLTYIHFTSEDFLRGGFKIHRHTVPLSSKEQTRLSNLIKGPTWERSERLVTNMFRVAEAMKGETLKFRLYGIRGWKFLRSTEKKLRPLLIHVDHIHAQQHLEKYLFYVLSDLPRDASEVPLTCLNAAQIIAVYGGIIFRTSGDYSEPRKFIQHLKEATFFQAEPNSERSLFNVMRAAMNEEGAPFVINREEEELRDKIKSAAVILTPYEGDLEETEGWLHSISGRNGWLHNISGRSARGDRLIYFLASHLVPEALRESMIGRGCGASW